MASVILGQNDIKPNIIEVGKFYPATVVENSDLTKHDDKQPLGRVKFRIPILFDDIDDELLPWAIPHNLRWAGGQNTGTFSVPEKKAKILIKFMTPDVYNPIYYGYPYTIKEQLELLTKEKVDKDEYPKKHIIYNFKNKCYIWVNTDYEDEKLREKFFFYNTGNVQTWSGKNVDHFIKDDYQFIVEEKYSDVIVTLDSKSGFVTESGEDEHRRIYRLMHYSTYKKDSFRVYEGRDIQTMYGQSFHTFADKSSAQYAKGRFQEVSQNFMIRVSNGDLLVCGSGKIRIIGDGNVEVSGRGDVTVGSSGGDLYLVGGEIFHSAPLTQREGSLTSRSTLDGIMDAYKNSGRLQNSGSVEIGKVEILESASLDDLAKEQENFDDSNTNGGDGGGGSSEQGSEGEEEDFSGSENDSSNFTDF